MAVRDGVARDGVGSGGDDVGDGVLCDGIVGGGFGSVRNSASDWVSASLSSHLPSRGCRLVG